MRKNFSYRSRLISVEFYFKVYPLFSEADVHAATPSLSNAAATWAGWAVTAVTAKFYRSQSDTVKSHTPLANKTLSKPGSLGKQNKIVFKFFNLLPVFGIFLFVIYLITLRWIIIGKIISQCLIDLDFRGSRI